MEVILIVGKGREKSMTCVDFFPVKFKPAVIEITESSCSTYTTYFLLLKKKFVFSGLHVCTFYKYKAEIALEKKKKV